MVHFAWLIVTALVIYSGWHLVVLVIAAIVGLVLTWLALCRRFPRTMWFVLGFIRGLFGRR